MATSLDIVERLRAENAEMRLALEAPTKFELELRAEIERLRAALEKIATFDDYTDMGDAREVALLALNTEALTGRDGGTPQSTPGMDVTSIG